MTLKYLSLVSEIKGDIVSTARPQSLAKNSLLLVRFKCNRIAQISDSNRKHVVSDQHFHQMPRSEPSSTRHNAQSLVLLPRHCYNLLHTESKPPPNKFNYLSSFILFTQLTFACLVFQLDLEFQDLRAQRRKRKRQWTREKKKKFILWRQRIRRCSVLSCCSTTTEVGIFSYSLILTNSTRIWCFTNWVS